MDGAAGFMETVEEKAAQGKVGEVVKCHISNKPQRMGVAGIPANWGAGRGYTGIEKGTEA